MKTLLIITIFLSTYFTSICQISKNRINTINNGVGIPCSLNNLMNKILSADGGINIKSSLLVKQNLHTAVKSEIQVGILGGTTSVFQIIDGEHDSKFERKVTSAVFGLKLNFVNELGKKSIIYGGPTFIYSAICYKCCAGYNYKTYGIGICPHIGVARILTKNSNGYLELEFGRSLINAGLRIELI